MHLVAEDECGFFWLQLGLKPLGNEQREFQSTGIQWGGYIKDTGVFTEFYFLSNHLANYHMPDVEFYILWDMQI